MTHVTSHERPGVYSAYDASSVVRTADNAKTVGIAALWDGAAGGETFVLTTYEQAVETFGASAAITTLIRLLFLNGGGTVVAAPVAGEDYDAAFAALEELEDIDLVLCDSTKLAVHQALRDSVVNASNNKKERIAVVPAPPGQPAELAAHAGEINSPRVVIAAPGDADGHTTTIAAAVAGLIAGEPDPARPLNGAQLYGLSGLSAKYSDNDIDLLVRSGVTPLETRNGVVSILRAVTTCTKNGTVPDTTWRELTAILVVDDVIATVRNSLHNKFRRVKNTQQTRGAIRSQVILDLENKLAAESITGYDAVTVTQKDDDPSVCLVDFSFTVAHGLNQIWLTAHITV